ncbi:MAG: glutamyl-tRNA amidotransferase [Candidatus Vogelbacteria bacterium CG10_big_fil_rev_8_21_14_0_10_50_13]|uniref:Glutamyl-tRNA amidotransferase n=1 Tax=Candidatus Vogelbacteria bacterium CG10_big_fil_rev_8_21_14_0_10_50_13 TaxID=1975044 RepID=A0A2H0RIJ4_9BACT|nr:MAG: glutamyl-tRNA amidotransferase [Candidatus Vogelbacteria bacterium CG10_big_fil_rev_8_21_14_0_10_50_13]
MSLQQDIKEQIKKAMKGRDEVRLAVVRGLAAAMTNELVAKGKKPTDELTDEEALAVVKRASKQRQDSISQFNAGGREDLAGKEEAELKIIEEYLPAQMSREEIEKIAKAKIAELGADKSKLGILIGTVVKETNGAADGAVVKNVVQELLG